MIYPSIDLMDGKVVQLVQGKREKKTIEIDDYLGVADSFKDYTIQVIDLDAAMDRGNNIKIIKRLCKKYRCRVGGGIRTIEKAKEILFAGADKIIIGSAAFSDDKVNMDFMRELNKSIPREKIIVALDSMGGMLLVHGWKKNINIRIEKAIQILGPYCSEFLCTYVDKEGLMQGTNIDFFRRLRSLTRNKITAAGGISSTEEIKKLEKLGIDAVIGTALYKGKINLDLLKKG